MFMLQMRSNSESQQGWDKNQNQKASWVQIEQTGLKQSFCGSNAASDMLVWLKELALDPCEPEELEDSILKFRNQTLKFRKLWYSNNAGCSHKKRKCEQISKRGKLALASGLPSEDSNYQTVRKLNFQLTVRNSCSSDSVLTFDNISQGKQLCTDSNTSDNTTNWDPFKTDISLVDTDESVDGSNLLTPENLIVQEKPLVDYSDLICSSHSSSSEEKLQQAERVLITDSESETENLPRAVIPIGSRFQAELPDWIGPVDKQNFYGSSCDSETLKWLGTKIWPIKEISPDSNKKKIGRGRPDYCSCVSPGTADCMRCHLLSARRNLQSELGSAFLNWKFDEMGEVVSKKWTLKEQNMFESLMQKYPLSSGSDFWERALKRFRSKSKHKILSYYYNVFIPRHLSRQTKSSLSHVDSDEDQFGGDEGDDHKWRRCIYKHVR